MVQRRDKEIWKIFRTKYIPHSKVMSTNKAIPKKKVKYWMEIVREKDWKLMNYTFDSRILKRIMAIIKDVERRKCLRWKLMM